MSPRALRRYVLIAFAVLLALMPQLPVPEFWITQANYIGLYTLVALGLVLLTGIAGLTSFGQAAFVGLGAYTAAYLTVTHGVSPWLTVWIGLGVTDDLRLGTVIGHSGGLPGYGSHMRWIPDRGVGVVAVGVTGVGVGVVVDVGVTGVGVAGVGMRMANEIEAH